MALKSDVLIVFALENEAQGLFRSFPKIYCGVGKVNAAYRLTKALSDWQNQHKRLPGMILNLGSAGSPHFKTGTLANCTRFIQRDMDTTALGTPAYATPFEDIAVPLVNGARFSDYPEAVCGSGDNFVTDASAAPWNVIDMEAYALAKICALENIPFGCLKYITDGADGNAANTWEKALADAAQVMHRALNTL